MASGLEGFCWRWDFLGRVYGFFWQGGWQFEKKSRRCVCSVEQEMPW